MNVKTKNHVTIKNKKLITLRSPEVTTLFRESLSKDEKGPVFLSTDALWYDYVISERFCNCNVRVPTPRKKMPTKPSYVNGFLRMIQLKGLFMMKLMKTLIPKG